MYTPFAQAPWPFIAVVVRRTATPEAAAGALRQALARLDPEQAAGEIRTLDDYAGAIDRDAALHGDPPRQPSPRWRCCSPGSACIGVMAYSVAQRRREIGIRMALGAQPADVRSLVVSQALGSAPPGWPSASPARSLSTRVLGSLLFGVTRQRSG